MTAKKAHPADRRRIRWAIPLLVALVAPHAAAQQQQGPLTPPPSREVRRIEVNPTPQPPPIPVEEILQRIGVNEDQIRRAHDLRNYRLSVRVQEFPAAGGETAEMQMVSEIYTKADGKRYGRVIEEKPGGLRMFDFFREDLQELAALPLFVFTTEGLARYEFEYAGRQLVDEIPTFVFRVRPRKLERIAPQFEGVVWVDDRDFVVVKTFGKWVAEVIPDAQKIPFTMFETYREPVDDTYWFPTFVRSEETVRNEHGEARLRLTIRFSNFVAEPPRP